MKPLYFKNRALWRSWLQKYSSTAEEVWLLYYKRQSGKDRLEYEDAVQEAICFGWIDGKIKRIDDLSFAQRFTPRRPGSRWSQENIQRAEKMIKTGQITDAGLRVFNRETVVPVAPLPAKLPFELEQKFRANGQTWQNFCAFSPSYQRMTIGWVASAKRAETQLKRLQQLIEFSRRNEKIKFM